MGYQHPVDKPIDTLVTGHILDSKEEHKRRPSLLRLALHVSYLLPFIGLSMIMKKKEFEEFDTFSPKPKEVNISGLEAFAFMVGVSVVAVIVASFIY